MKISIDQSFVLQEPSANVLVRGEEIWGYGAKSRNLLRYTGLSGRSFSLTGSLPPISAENTALTWDGDNLLVADQKRREVFRVDPDSGDQQLVMDPNELEFGNYDPALLVKDAIVSDIAWFDSTLYVAVQAGYSSAFYGIDLKGRRIVSHRLAPGPKPWGLDFDPADGALYTVDSRNRILRRFDSSGGYDVGEIPSEWEKPRGLSYESEARFWSTDEASGNVLRIRVEG